MSLTSDYCHWCEGSISRPNDDIRWLDEDGSASCLFHPANWDVIAMKTTGETAEHQTLEEIHQIIKSDYHRRKALRQKTPLRSVDDNAVMISKKPQRTSAAAAKAVLPHSGTVRRRVYDLIAASGERGMTDDELERMIGGKHQTISASRRSLVVDGYIVDSNNTRKNPQGRECIVWVVQSVPSEWLFALNTIVNGETRR